jgi:1-acyl-sn-glycerol-3-phosphate acyltransferase
MSYNGPAFDHLGPPRPLGTRAERYIRRALVWPAYLIVVLLLIGLAPILFPVVALVDRFSRTNWVLVRSYAFFIVFFCFELYAIVHIAGIYIFVGKWIRGDYRRFYRAQYAIQQRWVAAIVGICFRLFGIRLHVEGEDALDRGPYLLFVRHCSMFDTPMIPYLCFPRGISLRIVLKRELLFDAALDMSFNALPNCFVRRGSADGEKEVRAVGDLLDNLDEREAIFFYPEGTRRTPEKHARILQKIKDSGDTELYERALRYRHVLPPRPGGSLELLHRNPGHDLVFCAHTGLEHTTTIAQVYRGGLVHRDLHYAFRRVPFAEIPADPAEHRQWLFDQWQWIDDWVAAKLEDAAAKGS